MEAESGHRHPCLSLQIVLLFAGGHVTVTARRVADGINFEKRTGEMMGSGL
jgi:hypothetical protein